MSSKPLLPIVYDTETTGIDPITCKIVQLSASTFTYHDENSDPVVHTLFNSLANPGIHIPEGSSEIHGITDDKVKWEPSSRRVVQTFALLLERLSATYTVVLCGHNVVRYDDIVIAQHLPEVFDKYSRCDTYIEIVRRHPDKDHKLGLLYEWYLGQKAIDAHNSAADCYMSSMILAQMLHDTKQTVWEMAESQVEPRIWETMPFGKYKGKPISSIPNDYFLWMRANFTQISHDLEATICHKVGECA